MVRPLKQSRTALAPAAQKAAALLRKEKKEPVVTDKQRNAIHAMVFEGQKRPDAAKTAGMTDEALRIALTKTTVLAYLNEQIEVLRTSGRPRALHTMIDLLDDKNSSVKFKAAEYLDGQNRGTHTVGATVNVQVNNTVSVTPGYVIDLTPDTQDEARQIRHLRKHGPNGLPYQADVPDDE
jgi:hypothetical protein